MKKIYSTIMMLAMMVAALSFTACSSDDDDDNKNGGNTESPDTKQGAYTFLYNGKPYWYGEYVAKTGGISSRAYFHKISNDGEVNLTITAYEQSSFEPYEDEHGLTYYNYDENIECTFMLKDFNPETANKGDVVGYYQNVRSDVGYDMFNYVKYGKNGNKPNIVYSWTGDAVGSIKFVSYRKVGTGNYHILILDFQNLNMSKITQGDYVEQATINGEIMFIDNTSGVVYEK